MRELDHGGIERDVTKMALNLDRSRFQTHVASYRAEGMRFEELRDAGVPLLHLPITSFKSPSTLSAAAQMRRYIREHKIRLVHSWDPSAIFAVPVARFLRVPVVLSSALGSRDLEARNSRLGARLTDRMVDAIVVNCEAMRRHMIDDEHVPRERIELCYNGVVTTEFFPAQARRADVISNCSLVIGTVCVLRPEKALTVLQEAFSRVRHLSPHMKLVIVGSGPQLPSLQENAVRLGIAEVNVFISATRDVANWMRSMDIFVLPSYSEAFSNSLLEAMACGCTVVGSRVGGTPELIGSNSERGFLFKSGDAADLAGKLAKLVTDTDTRRNFATRAANFVRQNLTIEIAAERLAAIYEKLLQRNAGRQVQFAAYVEQLS